MKKNNRINKINTYINSQLESKENPIPSQIVNTNMRDNPWNKENNANYLFPTITNNKSDTDLNYILNEFKMQIINTINLQLNNIVSAICVNTAKINRLYEAFNINYE